MVPVRSAALGEDLMVPIGSPAFHARPKRGGAMPKAWELDGPVITNLRGGRLTTRAVENILAQRIVAAGLRSSITPHWLRHRFCHPHAQRRCRSVLDPGDARPCEPRHHAARPRQRRPFERGFAVLICGAPESTPPVCGTTIPGVRNAGHVVFRAYQVSVVQDHQAYRRAGPPLCTIDGAVSFVTVSIVAGRS